MQNFLFSKPNNRYLRANGAKNATSLGLQRRDQVIIVPIDVCSDGASWRLSCLYGMTSSWMNLEVLGLASIMRVLR